MGPRIGAEGANPVCRLSAKPVPPKVREHGLVTLGL